jgi:thioredoxin-related protein
MSSKVMAAALAAFLLAAPAGAADFDYFHRTYAEAEKVAKKEGKPLYLHFTTRWCGWCRRIENDIYKLPEGKKALSPFACATLDCTVPQGQRPSENAAFNQKLMDRYRGPGYPYLVMVTPDGVILNRITGYKPMAAFKEDLAKAEANLKKYQALQAYAAKADKTSYDYHLKALEFYSDTTAWDQAGEAAAALKKLDPELKKGKGALISYALLRAAPDKADDAKVTALEDAVIRHDAKNQAGYLEPVLWSRASRRFNQGYRQRDEAQKARRTQEAIDAIRQLIKQAEKLSDPVNTYGYLGWLNMRAGRNDEAITALEKALALDPDGPRAPMLKRMIEQAKNAKAEKATQK